MKNIKLNSKWGKALIVVLVLALAVLGIIYPSFGDTVGRVLSFNIFQQQQQFLQHLLFKSFSFYKNQQEQMS